MKKKISKSVLMAALITGLCIGGVQSAFAAENLNTFALDEYVVTATRTEKNLLKVPAVASVITKEEIQEKNVTNVKDALKGQSGLYIDTSMYESGGIQMRGFDSKNVLVLFDGQPMNNGWNGEVNWESIPVEQIERIEVVRGAASSLYGGRAVGGVINIISKDSIDKKVAGSVALTYGSNSTWKKAIDVQGKINDKWSFGVGYENRKSDGFGGKRKAIAKSDIDGSTSSTSDDYTPTGEEESITVPQLSPNNGSYPGRYLIGGPGDRETESENINVSFKYNFDENKSLKYSFTRSEHEYRYNDPFTYVRDSKGKPVFGPGNYITQNGDYLKLYPGHYLNYVGENETNIHTLNYIDKENLWNVNFGIQDVEKSGYTSLSSDKDGTSLDYNGKGDYASYPSKNYNLDLQKTWENIGKHTITVGGNWKDETMDRIDYDLANWKNSDSIVGSGSIVAKGSARTISFFVQDEYKFNDKFTMYLGGRYDEYKKYDGYSNKHDLEDATYNEFSPKISFEYAPDDNLSYYASYGHSFGVPTLYQVYRESSSYQANPELEPEKTDTFEIGVKKKFDKTMLGLALFQAETDNIIYSGKGTVKKSDGTLKSMYQNGAEATRKGIELDVNHKFNDNLSAYLNYTWQDAKETDSKGKESTMYEIPEHLLHFGFDYTDGKFNAILDGQYVSERQEDDVVTGEFYSEDAFFIMNAYFNYKLTPQATLQFGIENIFDKEYYVSEGAKERTYYAGLRYSF